MRAPAAAAALCALAAGAAVAWAGDGGLAHASDEPPTLSIGLFHNGTLIDKHGIQLVASEEPAAFELRLGHREKDEHGVPAFRELATPLAQPGGVPAISMNVNFWHVSDESHADPAPPILVDHGNGTASLTVGRSALAEGQVHIAAGEAYNILAVTVLPPLPPVGYGSPDGPERPPPRIAAQARQPLCADVTHEASGMAYGADPHGIGSLDYLLDGAALSGVPPIEGTVHQEGFYEVPVGERVPEWDWLWWGCSTWASFGTQAPQLLRLCEIPGHYRAHHYAWHPFDSALSSTTRMISPYTGYTTVLAKQPALTYAAAPGPYWEYLGSGGYNVTLPYRPDEYVPPGVLYPVRRDGTASMLVSRVIGTYSSVPELLPFDDLVAIRATGFHSDDVVFDVSPGAGIGLPQDGALAYVNGTAVPVKIKKHPSGIPGTTAQVRASVSEAAWASGILVKGITDALAVEGSVVRDLHEVTLVAEIPVDAGRGRDYDRLDPSRSVEPWGCWPREGGGPMRVGSREPWPAAQGAGARMLPSGPAREHVAMGEPPDERMEDTASPEPTFVDVRAPAGWGEGTVISARVASSSAWPPSPAAAQAPRVDVANRGDGTAVVGIGRGEPGEHAIEITATGPPGAVTEERTLRIVPPGGDGAAHWRMEMGGPPGGLMEARASPEPATLDVRAPAGWGGGTAITARVASSSPWPPLRGAAEAPGLYVADRGDGTATLAIGRGEPGEHVIEVTATGPPGAVTEERTLRIVKPPRAPPAPNLEPGLLVLVGGEPAGPVIELAASGAPARIGLRAEDPEGDPVRFSVAALDSSYGARAASMVRLADRGDGTADLLVDRSEPGELALEIAAADAHGEEWDVYLVRVAPAPGAALFMDGSRLDPPLVELRASGAPVALEARAGPDGGEPSVRALRSAHWGGGAAAAPPSAGAAPGGAVPVAVDASAPGEHLVEVSDAGGAVLYVIRVLPAAAG